MTMIVDHPLAASFLSFLIFALAAYFGDWLRKRLGSIAADDRDEYSVVLTATLTLLGLIIGFSFSMAISRYDQRKNYEEAEANAIGTEYLRANLLPPGDAAHVHELLKKYVDQRILFYETRDRERLARINTDTADLQNQLWAVLQPVAAAQPTPIVATAVVGMNDVLNSQGYTQAAWWNRIPHAAWVLMGAIALFCNVMIGYGARRTDRWLFLVVPLAVAISFFLIADIDSPRGGVIHVLPQNLLSLKESLPTT